MAYILGTQKRSFKALNSLDKIYAVLVLGFLCAVFAMLSSSLQDFHLSSLLDYIVRIDNGEWKIGIIAEGLFTTLRVSFWCLLIAFCSGGIVGVLSAHKKGLASLPSKIYVLSLRNMPPLILLFLVFFFASSLLSEWLLDFEFTIAKLPTFWKNLFYTLVAPEGQLDRMLAVVVTLGLYEGAYIAEIVRAGIESINKGQWEAGKATGLTKWQIRRYIIAPQAMRQSLAPLTGQSISTIKDSAIASIISLQELTFKSMELMNVTGKTIELWLLTALCYFLLAFFLEKLSHKMENSIIWKPQQ